MNQSFVTKEIEDKARTELGETETIREVGLREIKEWMAKQQFSREFLSDLGLLNFLRGCKFSQERTREKLSHYLTAKTNRCEILRNRDPLRDDLEEVLSKGMMLFMFSENLEMLLIRWENCDTKKVSLVNVIKVGLMVFDILINESHTIMINGHTIVIDCKNLPFGYMRQLSPSLIRDLACVILKAYPVRIKAVHVINCFPFMSLIFSMFKPFLPQKIISRVKFYTSSNMNDLYTHIPLMHFPVDYGGEAKSVNHLTDSTRRILEEKRAWFLKREEHNNSDREKHKALKQLIIS